MIALSIQSPSTMQRSLLADSKTANRPTATNNPSRSTCRSGQRWLVGTANGMSSMPSSPLAVPASRGQRSDSCLVPLHSRHNSDTARSRTGLTTRTQSCRSALVGDVLVLDPDLLVGALVVYGPVRRRLIVGSGAGEVDWPQLAVQLVWPPQIELEVCAVLAEADVVEFRLRPDIVWTGFEQDRHPTDPDAVDDFSHFPTSVRPARVPALLVGTEEESGRRHRVVIGCAIPTKVEIKRDGIRLRPRSRDGALPPAKQHCTKTEASRLCSVVDCARPWVA